MASVRQTSLVDGRMKASLAIDEDCPDGRTMRRIDANSPLHGLGREDLERRHGEILVAFQGIDEILLAPVHFRCSYGAGDLRFNERFRDMVRMDGPDSICLDFSRFDETEPLTQPLMPGAPGHGE